MNVKIYKIMNRKTKQFWDGDSWNPIGKVWHRIGNAKNSLNYMKKHWHPAVQADFKNAVIVYADVTEWKEIQLS